MPVIIPIVAEIAAVAGAIGTFVSGLGVIGTALVSAGVGLAASYLLQKLMPKPDTSEPPSGVNFERQYGTNVPRQVACGLVGIAGHDTYVNTHGEANKDLEQIYTLSDYYATALTRVAINGVWVPLGPDTGGGATPLDGDFKDLIRFRFFDGRQTTADSYLVSSSNPSGRWSNNAIGLGMAAVVVSMLFDKDKNNSFPDFFFEFKGAPLYDWRKDSTVGGSGTHRWNDPTTHEYSENPIIIEYNYRRGFRINGDLFCGMDMPASDLPLAKWTNAANICDEAYPGDGLPRYRCSVLLNSTSVHSDNLQSLSTSCGSMQIDAVDGSWPLVGSNQPSVMTFTDNDIIADAEFRYSQKRSMQELVNSVSGNYPEPSQQWSMIGYQEQTSDAYVAIDRRTRDIAIDFPQVPYARQAAQLASIYLYENRYEAKATLTLRPRFQVLEAGDWVTWNSARYGSRRFIVTKTQILSLESTTPRNVILNLQERDGSIYAGIAPPVLVPPVGIAGPVYATELLDFAAIAVTVQGSNGRIQPAIRVSWLPVSDVTITDVEIIYYPTAQSSSVMRKIVSANTSLVTLVEGVVADTDYTVQSRIITDPLRTTVFDAGVSVHTTNTPPVGLADLEASIQYNVDTLQSLFDDRLRVLENKLASVGANDIARNWVDKKTDKYQLSAIYGRVNASIEQVRTTMTAEDAALASDIETVQANVDDNTAAIQTNATAIASLNSSFGSYQTAVSAQFGTLTSSVTANSSAIAGNSSAIGTLNGYAAAQYAIKLDVNGYAIGFNLFNGGGGISAAVFTVDKFQVAFPGVSGGAAIPIFTIGNVAGVPKIGIRSDMFIDGVITARFIGAGEIDTVHLAAQSVTATNMAANSVTAENGAIKNLSIQSLKIGDNAVTVLKFAEAVGPFNFSAPPFTNVDIISITLNIDTTGLNGKPVDIAVNSVFDMDRANGNSYNAYVWQIVDGVRTNRRSYNVSGAPTGIWPFPCAFGLTITGNGGIITVQFGIAYGRGASNANIQNLFISAVAGKR